ncbi:hypothetical protein LJC58_05860, partial [Lachnospiraceae bacterium OttesenSCG-928-D06]|nr:hypothetical protein [Lachnospiraceae bacterium OttesenSCG-928-D06]
MKTWIERHIVELIMAIMAIVELIVIGKIIYHTYQTLSEKVEEKDGNGWKESSAYDSGNNYNSAFEDIYEELLIAIEKDQKLHLETLLYEPEEYDIWDIVRKMQDIDLDYLNCEEEISYKKIKYCYEMYEWKCMLPDYT